ncbi:MAG: THUMP domain-containing protein [Sulfolobales archaeon]
MVEEVEVELKECPQALATTYVGKEDRGVRELRDILFPLDPAVKVEKSGFRDVILIYTKISPKDLKDLIFRRKPSSVARLVVVDLCIHLRSKDDIIRVIEESIKLFNQKCRGSRFYVDCIRRGRFVESCHSIESSIGREVALRGLGSVNYKNPECVIKIEVVERIVMIALMKPYEDRLRRNMILFLL